MKSIAFIVASFLATPLLADAPSPDEVKIIGAECSQAIMNDDADLRDRLAFRLIEFRGFTVGLAERQAAACITAAMGEKWVYSTHLGRFVTEKTATAKEEIARIQRDAEDDEQQASIQLQKEISARRAAISEATQSLMEENQRLGKVLVEAQEAFEKASKDRVRARTLVACNTLYGRDQDAALLSPVCNPLFVANGLPDD